MNFAELSALHLQAIVVMDLLEGRRPSHALPTSDFVQATALASSLKQGLKSKVISLSAAFYAALLSPPRLAAAYAQLLQQQPHLGQTSEEFQFVMAYLAERCRGALSDPLPVLEPEEALVLALLEITRTPGPALSISQRAADGSSRQTTFPLTQNVLLPFLQPLGGMTPLLQRVLVFHKDQVLSNPAAWIVERGLPPAADIPPKPALPPRLNVTEKRRPMALAPTRSPRESSAPLRTGSYLPSEAPSVASSTQAPEWKRLLRALNQGEALSELLQSALPPSLRAELTQEMLHKLYSGFCLYSDQGFEAIRANYLAALDEQELATGRDLLAQLERACYQLASWFKQDVRLELPQALQRLNAEQAARNKRNPDPQARTHQASTSAYARYRQQA